jgi:hypothetical protein
MIKGPDLTPVSNCPGHYTSKSTISLTAREQQLTIRPTDILDLSNAEFLVVQFDELESRIAWDKIIRLDFEETEIAPIGPHSQLQDSAQWMMHFSLRKRAV